MKSFGSKDWVLPQPVLIIGTYDRNGNPNAMNAAWGGQWDRNEIFISLGSHQTTDNLALNDELTIAFATTDTLVASDFVGIVSRRIDATPEGGYFVAQIVNTLCKEEYLAPDGKPDVEKLNLITFDPVHLGYIRLGNRVGDAFSAGNQLK